MSTDLGRHSHAYLDVAHRRRKAEKVARILEEGHPLKGQRVLEIGAGSGVISALLAERVGDEGSVTAVDVIDERVIRNGYDFIRVEGVRLPLPSESFDVVVSNHVLEHVGGPEQQLTHLTEIARVMRRNGIGYLAVPNRWALREPHFRLWFLSWLPGKFRDSYVRLARRGHRYDCEPPGPLRIRSMLRVAAIRYEDVTGSAVRLVGEIEGATVAQALGRYLPDAYLRMLAPVYPTIIFRLKSCSARHRSPNEGRA